MKMVTSVALNLASALLIVLASAGIGAAQTGNDTCVGQTATIGGTCTPLTNATSGNNSNTALGSGALFSNATGHDDTATGEGALVYNTTGIHNTATGSGALSHNTTGDENTATGSGALEASTTGDENTATGSGALSQNTTGGDNTATGEGALSDNTSGADNTAAGAFALELNTTGAFNTATGEVALEFNTTGAENTATGEGALESNTTGGDNTAAGLGALNSNTTGDYNTATGSNALNSNSTGGYNIGIGYNAGDNLTTGSNNIDIGNEGVAGESATIRIGTQGTQTATYIAGIFGAKKIKSGCDVVAANTGMLACLKSSARYKRDIHDMGHASDGLMKLRPVSFRYKNDPEGTKQYGLVAEEVEQVYPELVVYDTDGKVESVRYSTLTSMLLNEVQKQAREKDAQIAALRRQVASQQKQIAGLKSKDAQIDALAERMNALERQARLARPEHLASAMR